MDTPYRYRTPNKQTNKQRHCPNKQTNKQTTSQTDLTPVVTEDVPVVDKVAEVDKYVEGRIEQRIELAAQSEAKLRAAVVVLRGWIDNEYKKARDTNENNRGLLDVYWSREIELLKLSAQGVKREASALALRLDMERSQLRKVMPGLVDSMATWLNQQTWITAKTREKLLREFTGFAATWVVPEPKFELKFEDVLVPHRLDSFDEQYELTPLPELSVPDEILSILGPETPPATTDSNAFDDNDDLVDDEESS